jgi:hypothetical protein
MTLLLAPHNSVFAAAFAMLLCFALVEGISLLMGLGVSDFLSDLIGLPDAPEAGEASEAGGAAPWLVWLEIGKVPFLISLCAFLAIFSIGGMLLQESLQLAGLSPLSQIVAATAAFFMALPGMKLANRLLGGFWPQDESSAFAPELLLGRVGVVTIGTATAERAAEVKVVGPDDRNHYVMCFAKAEAVAQGAEIILLTRDEATGHYYGEKNANPDLSPAHYL